MLLWLLALAAYPEANAAVRVYPAPAGEPLSSRFTVTVDKQNVPVYVAKSTVIAALAQPGVTQSGEAAFASFDIDGRVAVTITLAAAVHTAKILPSSGGIVPVVSGNRVSFAITSPAQLTVEINGD